MKNNDEHWMERCLQLALNGSEGAAPNPLVGAVIVHDGRIIGEGFHAQCGQAHAEVNAIASVNRKELLKDSCLYVNLEPCAHYGRTPPCAKLIIETGIPKVVVGMVDPFSEVDGAGIRMLRDAGIQVKTGVMEEQCRWINRRFITFHTKKRPYVTLKWAQSADGFMAPDLLTNSRDAIYISNDISVIRAHHLRATHQAILVGRRTADTDNPTLTTRLWYGQNPLRVVIDPEGKLLAHLNIFNREAKTLVAGFFDQYRRGEKAQYDFLPISDYETALQEILDYLYHEGIQSLLVEGGAEVLNNFLYEELWDEAFVEVGDRSFGSGVDAPHIEESFLADHDTFGGHRFNHYIYFDEDDNG